MHLLRCQPNESPWTDLHPGAAWLETVKEGHELALACHPLFTSGLGLTLAHICPDILHILDLGACQHLVAGFLSMLVWQAGFVGTLEERIRYLWHELSNSYEALRTPSGERVPQRKVWNLFARSRTANPTAYPVLGSKGAQGRHAVGAVLHLCKRLVAHLSAFDHVIEALEGLHDFYVVVLPARMYLPPDDITRAQDGMHRFLVHYQHLCYTNMVAGRMLFFVDRKMTSLPLASCLGVWLLQPPLWMDICR